MQYLRGFRRQIRTRNALKNQSLERKFLKSGKCVRKGNLSTKEIMTLMRTSLEKLEQKGKIQGVEANVP